MRYTVERFFRDINHSCCLGSTYEYFDNIFEDLIRKMKDKIGEPILEDRQYHNLRFHMTISLYKKFCMICQTSGHDSDMYRGIPITVDPTLCIGDSEFPDGILRLVYEESGAKRYSRYYDFWTDQSKIENALAKSYCIHDAEVTYGLWAAQLKTKPHIDHVKFNGPATIVFWKDGTKTVVKHDGNGRKDKRVAILYAFIRKIYGEGKPYHNILNEIEYELWKLS